VDVVSLSSSGGGGGGMVGIAMDGGVNLIPCKIRREIIKDF